MLLYLDIISLGSGWGGSGAPGHGGHGPPGTAGEALAWGWCCPEKIPRPGGLPAAGLWSLFII